jgi:hypothetical protein
MNLSLRKFNPENMPDDKVCVFIGKRGTGKSVLVTDILYHKRHIPSGIVMSATEEGNHHYQSFVPDLFIYSDYDKEAIERVIERQKQQLQTREDIQSAFILLDDCMYDRKFMKDSCIRQVFMNGRHWKLFFMLTMQYCMDLSPDLRANVDYVFILRENVIQNREKLYKSFFGIFPTFDMFNQVMTSCTENYECLVLDNTSKSNRIQDCVFWYKASVRKNFRIGSPEMWAFHKRYYNPKHITEGSKNDPNKAKKRETVKIVKKS